MSKNFPRIRCSNERRTSHDWNLRFTSTYFLKCHLNNPQSLWRSKPKVPHGSWGELETNTWNTAEALSVLHSFLPLLCKGQVTLPVFFLQITNLPTYGTSTQDSDSEQKRQKLQSFMIQLWLSCRKASTLFPVKCHGKYFTFYIFLSSFLKTVIALLV